MDTADSGLYGSVSGVDDPDCSTHGCHSIAHDNNVGNVLRLFSVNTEAERMEARAVLREQAFDALLDQMGQRTAPAVARFITKGYRFLKH